MSHPCLLYICIKFAKWPKVGLKERDDAHAPTRGKINTTHQQGGGSPRAWRRTKHVMFLFAVFGTQKTDNVDSHSITYSSREGQLMFPDQRYGYRTGQDINISPAPFLSSPSSSLFDTALAFPTAVAHWKKCRDPKTHPHRNGKRSTAS